MRLKRKLILSCFSAGLIILLLSLVALYFYLPTFIEKRFTDYMAGAFKLEAGFTIRKCTPSRLDLTSLRLGPSEKPALKINSALIWIYLFPPILAPEASKALTSW